MPVALTDTPLISALVTLAALGLLFGGVLGFAAVRLRREGNPLSEQINALLPQTQCGQCGYPGCRPYAEAIAEGDAINKCPPGGEETIQQLAKLLDVPAQPLDASHGVEQAPMVAYIHEDLCIGCTKCILACPVDAILGAAKQMHTVIADECTGCDLCVEPCPVDCIDMIPRTSGITAWQWPLPVSGEVPKEQHPATDSSGIIASDRDAA